MPRSFIDITKKVPLFLLLDLREAYDTYCALAGSAEMLREKEDADNEVILELELVTEQAEIDMFRIIEEITKDLPTYDD